MTAAPHAGDPPAVTLTVTLAAALPPSATSPVLAGAAVAGRPPVLATGTWGALPALLESVWAQAAALPVNVAPPAVPATAAAAATEAAAPPRNLSLF